MLHLLSSLRIRIIGFSPIAKTLYVMVYVYNAAGYTRQILVSFPNICTLGPTLQLRDVGPGVWFSLSLLWQNYEQEFSQRVWAKTI